MVGRGRKEASSGLRKLKGPNESLGGDGQAQGRSVTSDKDSSGDLGRMLGLQIEEYRRFLAEMDEIKATRKSLKEKKELERFEKLCECIRHSTILVAEELRKSREMRKMTEGLFTERLPLFDGSNLNVFEWQERVQAIAKSNHWSFSRLMENMPTSLTRIAKRAFNALSIEEKTDESKFFKRMIEQIDPWAAENNRALIRFAKRNSNETMSTYINRLREYIRRAGRDPNHPDIQNMLCQRIHENLPSSDERLLRAAVDDSNKLNLVISKANLLLGDLRHKSEDEQKIKSLDEVRAVDKPNLEHQERTKFWGMCGKCHEVGHSRKYCPKRAKM